MHTDPDSGATSYASRHHVAFAICLSPAYPDEEWLDACYRLTPRVERVSASSALLDLGAGAGALMAARTFLGGLAARGVRARVGLGASGAIAQLALLTAPRATALTHIPPEATLGFLHDVPVDALARLHPAGSVTPEVVARLQRYGLHTLGHVARLGELALRRQFGAAGAFRAALARGEEGAPLCPTPAPMRLHVHLRLDAPERPEHVLAAAPRAADRVGALLRRRGLQARALRLGVYWEDGGVQSARLRLRQHTNDARILAMELRRVLIGLLPPPGDAGEPDSSPGAIIALRLTLSDCAPAHPEQSSLWRPVLERRRAALMRVEESLARRHGRAVLRIPRAAAPPAIFAEDRYRLDALLPTGTDGPDAATPAGWHTGRAAAGGPWRDVPRSLHWW